MVMETLHETWKQWCLGDTGVHIFDFAVNAVGDIDKIFADLKTYYDKGKNW